MILTKEDLNSPACRCPITYVATLVVSNAGLRMVLSHLYVLQPKQKNKKDLTRIFFL